MTTKAQIEQATYDCIARANAQWNVTIPHVRIEWFARGKAAGWAGITADQIWLVRYSEDACAKYPDYLLQDTVPHEVAHLVMFALKRKGVQGLGAAL